MMDDLFGALEAWARDSVLGVVGLVSENSLARSNMKPPRIRGYISLAIVARSIELPEKGKMSPSPAETAKSVNHPSVRPARVNENCLVYFCPSGALLHGLDLVFVSFPAVQLSWASVKEWRQRRRWSHFQTEQE